MVVVWTPEEIGNANFRVSQDQIVEFGNQILDDQKDDGDEPEIDQFKQSYVPACPKVGSISLSPRVDWKAPVQMS